MSPALSPLSLKLPNLEGCEHLTPRCPLSAMSCHSLPSHHHFSDMSPPLPARCHCWGGSHSHKPISRKVSPSGCPSISCTFFMHSPPVSSNLHSTVSTETALAKAVSGLQISRFSERLIPLSLPKMLFFDKPRLSQHSLEGPSYNNASDSSCPETLPRLVQMFLTSPLCSGWDFVRMLYYFCFGFFFFYFGHLLLYYKLS